MTQLKLSHGLPLHISKIAVQFHAHKPPNLSVAVSLLHSEKKKGGRVKRNRRCCRQSKSKSAPHTYTVEHGAQP